jgi:lipopolysaccharide transport system permease protein
VILHTQLLEQLSSATVLIRPRSPHLSADLGMSEAWRGRHLLAVFLWRDLKVRYKQTVLGVGWALLQPLLSVAVFNLIFSRVAKVPTGNIPYPVFVLCGLAPWQVFARGITRSSNNLVENQYLITGAFIPRLILPMAAVLSGLADFAIEFLLLLALMFAYRLPINAAAVVAVIPFLLLAIATALGVGLFLSALNVRYRDVGYVVPVIMQLLFLVTPVLYPANLVPPYLRRLNEFNPMANAVEGFRWALLHGAGPSLPGLIYSVMGVSGVLFVALFYFRQVERSFADVV